MNFYVQDMLDTIIVNTDWGVYQYSKKITYIQGNAVQDWLKYGLIKQKITQTSIYKHLTI